MWVFPVKCRHLVEVKKLYENINDKIINNIVLKDNKEKSEETPEKSRTTTDLQPH